MLSLSSNNEHAKRTKGRTEIRLHAFFISVCDGGEWSAADLRASIIHFETTHNKPLAHTSNLFCLSPQ